MIICYVLFNSDSKETSVILNFHKKIVDLRKLTIIERLPSECDKEGLLPVGSSFQFGDTNTSVTIGRRAFGFQRAKREEKHKLKMPSARA
jgi:hypothetical protein